MVLQTQHSLRDFSLDKALPSVKVDVWLHSLLPLDFFLSDLFCFLPLAFEFSTFVPFFVPASLCDWSEFEFVLSSPCVRTEFELSPLETSSLGFFSAGDKSIPGNSLWFLPDFVWSTVVAPLMFVALKSFRE